MLVLQAVENLINGFCYFFVYFTTKRRHLLLLQEIRFKFRAKKPVIHLMKQGTTQIK